MHVGTAQELRCLGVRLVVSSVAEAVAVAVAVVSLWHILQPPPPSSSSTFANPPFDCNLFLYVVEG